MNDLTLSSPPPGLSIADYTAIEDAVMETARGRWFLLEFARRQRASETARLTEAIDRLDAIMDRRAKSEIVQIAAHHAGPTQNPRDALAADVSERLFDIVWRLRENGFDDALCAELEEQANIVKSFSAPGQNEARLDHAQPVALMKNPDQTLPSDQGGQDGALKTSVDGSADEPSLSTHAKTATQDLRREDKTLSFAEKQPSAPINLLEAKKQMMEQRIAALSRLDELPIIEKLALFC